jgi:uncharacterized SAM-binding protein YcdF (DUF218 family)
MIFGKKKNWDEQYDEDYATREDRQERLRNKVIWFQMAGFFAFIAVLMTIAGLAFGMTMFEKLLTSLASPVGLVWLLLLFQAYVALLFRQAMLAAFSITGWLILTIFGNSFVANQLSISSESTFLETRFEDLPEMDVVFLLGGGTSTNRQGRAQISTSGDRVLTALRLFKEKKVKLIVCTGEKAFRTNPKDLHPHEEATQILTSLGVPNENLAMLRGINTSQEIENAVIFLQQQKMTDAKIGILTSAWHLDRAARIAGDCGLDPILIPCDFQSRYFANGPGLFIPSSTNLTISSAWLKERLAELVGR